MLRNKVIRALKKSGEIDEVGGSLFYRSDRAARLDGLIWRKIKRQAIERAGGISG